MKKAHHLTDWFGRYSRAALWAACAMLAFTSAGELLFVFLTAGKAPVAFSEQNSSNNNCSSPNLLSGAAWYFGGNGSGAGVSVVESNLQVNVGTTTTTTTGAVVFAYLTPSGSPLTLAAPGDSITLSFDLTLGSVANVANGINFGVFDSGGNRLTADVATLLGQDATFNNWTGYACCSRMGNATTVSTGLSVKERIGGTSTLFSSNTNYFPVLDTAAVAANSLMSSTTYTGNFITITRTAGGAVISGQIGTNTFSAADNSGAFDSFDAIAFGSNAGIAAGSFFKLDNIRVAASPCSKAISVPVTRLEQNFSNNDRAVQNLPSGAAWYFGGSGSGAGASAASGSLQVNAGNPSSGTLVAAYLTESGLPLMQAVPGDSVTLTFDLTFGSVSNAANGINFGIFNSGGTRLTSDVTTSFGQNPAFANWTGYACYSRIGNANSSTNGIAVRERLSTTGNTLFSSNVTNVPVIASAPVAGNSLMSATTYTGNFITITRTESGAVISGQIGANTFSAADNSGAFDSFDAIAFGSNAGIAAGSFFKLDNIKVIVKNAALNLTVRNTAFAARLGSYVVGGVPFAQGVLHTPETLQVQDAYGKPVPVQASSLGMRWPDGSVRWAQVCFPADVPTRSARTYQLMVSPGSSAPLSDQVTVETNTPQELIVNTGKMKVRFSRNAAPDGQWSAFPGQIEVYGNSGFETVCSNRPSVSWRADREHITPEEFAATNLNPNTLWSFGLGGRTVANNIIDNEYAAPHQVPWHDWTGRIERNLDYTRFFGGSVTYEVEETGPLRAVIAFRSAKAEASGEIGYCGRFFIYAGAKDFRVELTVENYEDAPLVDVLEPADPVSHTVWSAHRKIMITNTKHMREFSLGLTPAFAVTNVVFGRDGTTAAVSATNGSRLYQASATQAVLQAGSATSVYTRADGWVSVNGANRSMTLANRYFQEIFPKALAYDPGSGKVQLQLWPSDAPVPGFSFVPGRIRTYEFVVGFDQPGAGLSADAREPLLPYAGARYYNATKAVQPVLPMDDPAFPDFAVYVSNTVSRWNNQMLYGDLDYGDRVGWDVQSTASGYHGVPHEFFMFYLSSGDPAFFRLAEATEWHDVDIDESHLGSNAGMHQKQHNRGLIHFSAVPLWNITVWNFGDVDYYLLTGKRRMLRPLTNTLTSLVDGPGLEPDHFDFGRGTTLPFIHLSYMIEAVGDENALAELYPQKYIATNYPARSDTVGKTNSIRVVQRLKDVSDFLLDQYTQRATGTTFQIASFIASYPSEGCYRFWRLTGDTNAASAVLLSADYLYHEYTYATGAQRYKLYYEAVTNTMPGYADYTESQSWMTWYDETDLPAARAYQISGDCRWLEYPKASLNYRLEIMNVANNNYGMGSTIPSTLEIMREAGKTQADLSIMRPDLNYTNALSELSTLIDSCPDSTWTDSLRRECARVQANLGETNAALSWLGSCSETNSVEHKAFLKWIE